VIFAGWQSVSEFETYRRRECTSVWRRRQFDQLLSSFTNRIVYDRIRFGLSLFGHYFVLDVLALRPGFNPWPTALGGTFYAAIRFDLSLIGPCQEKEKRD
jgi:hypothetical protein